MIDDDKDGESNDTSKTFESARDLKPSSDWERQKILDDIGEPEVKLDYTPGGETERVVHKELSDTAKDRLKTIEERLQRARAEKGMNRSFDKNRDR